MGKYRDNKIVYEKFLVKSGKEFRLEDYDPAWPSSAKVSKKELKRRALEYLSEDVEELAKGQELLYAADSWSLLLIFQAMDAAGKDGTIKHVMSGVNPQGCQVFSFKHPSAEELDHNFLWRYMKALPERGRIGIFNRSYYEDVLIVRVHPDLVKAQKIPNVRAEDKLWRERFEDINNFEKHLSRNGTWILKFFLNVSREEQKKRFLDRLNDKSKHWKFSASDINERAHWNKYMKAYSEAVSATSTDWAPWFIVPADKKYVSRSVVASIITHAIRRLNLKYPEVSKTKREELRQAKATLLAE